MRLEMLMVTLKVWTAEGEAVPRLLGLPSITFHLVNGLKWVLVYEENGISDLLWLY